MEHMRRRTLQAHTQSQDMCCRRDPIAPQHISERPYSEIRRLFQGPVLVVQCTAYRQLRFSDLQPMCRSYIVRNPYISRSIDDQSDHTELSTKYSRRKLLYEKKFGDEYWFAKWVLLMRISLALFSVMKMYLVQITGFNLRTRTPLTNLRICLMWCFYDEFFDSSL